MDYEKAYKEALQLARSYYDKGTNEFLDTIFPELAESEDERKRKGLSKFLWDVANGVVKSMPSASQCQEWLSYLEKQNAEPFSCGHENGDSEKPNNQWSEEDERMLVGIIERGSTQIPPSEPALREEQMDWLMNRLKYLRPQPHWKPSEEQMNALYNIIYPCDYVDKVALESLYNDLKKL